MSVLQKATTHFKEALSNEMKTVVVPEWESTLYFKSVSTFAEEQKVIQLNNEGKIVEALVESLISKARDADGKRVFKGADKTTIMNEVDPAVIMRIVTEMNSSEIDDEELGN